MMRPVLRREDLCATEGGSMCYIRYMSYYVDYICCMKVNHYHCYNAVVIVMRSIHIVFITSLSLHH